jgi:hypothetical protein
MTHSSLGENSTASPKFKSTPSIHVDDKGTESDANTEAADTSGDVISSAFSTKKKPSKPTERQKIDLLRKVQDGEESSERQTWSTGGKATAAGTITTYVHMAQ